MTTNTVVAKELNHVTQAADSPAFSFFFRIHSGSEKQLHDSGHIRNRCHEVLKEQGFDTAILEKMKEKVDKLIEKIDFQAGAKSIGLFVSNNHAHSMNFFVNLPEQHYVGDFFSGYEIAYALQESAPYILFLMEPTIIHAFKGQGTHLETLLDSRSLEHLLCVYKKRAPKAADKDGKQNKGNEHDSTWKAEFLAAINDLCKSEEVPAYLVGITLAGLSEEEIMESGARVLASIDEVHQKSSYEKLNNLVEGLREKHRRQMAAELVDECNRALGAKKLASGIEEILACAKEGRGEVLILEDPSWTTDAVAKFSTVHEAIREVIEKHGRVAFVPEGTMKQWGGAAMILRY